MFVKKERETQNRHSFDYKCKNRFALRKGNKKMVCYHKSYLKRLNNIVYEANIRVVFNLPRTLTFNFSKEKKSLFYRLNSNC
jgi:hypothetical protein